MLWSSVLAPLHRRASALDFCPCSAYRPFHSTCLPQVFMVCFSVMAANIVGMIWSYRATQYKVGVAWQVTARWVWPGG